MVNDTFQTTNASRMVVNLSQFNANDRYAKQNLSELTGSNANQLMSRHRARNIPAGAEPLKKDAQIASMAPAYLTTDIR